jgi:histidyl-tRNA synthetase
MNDLFESELLLWRHLEDIIKSTCKLYNYSEIRTPILEELILFKRSIGEGTDIVEKEMFIINDGDHSYCMRPENTASVVRALIERGGLSADSEEKLYYIGPMFRKERPQKGRLRQFHQFGLEIFGIKEAHADIELIVLIQQLFDSLALKDITLKINSLGMPDERLEFKNKLKSYLSNFKDKLCEDCIRRIEINTLRVLDCKKASCNEIARHAPAIIDSLNEDSRMHFEQVLTGLRESNINYIIDNSLVRGLDYYNRTVFEFVADIGLGAQNAICAGGRYDGLFSALGNKIDIAAIGCAGGIERIIILLEEQKLAIRSKNLSLCLIGADTKGQKKARELIYNLRKNGIACDFCLSTKSVKAQMRRADRLQASFVGVIGEQEIQNKKITIKSLKHDLSEELLLDAENIIKFLNRNN